MTPPLLERLIKLANEEWDEQPSGEALLAGKDAVIDFLHMPEVVELLAPSASGAGGPMKCRAHGGYGFTSDCSDCASTPSDKASGEPDEIEDALWALHSYESNRDDGGRVYSEGDITRMVEAVRRLQSASAPTIEQIVQAVAKGWCSPNNAHKTADPELAYAIAAQILALVSSPSTGREKA